MKLCHPEVVHIRIVKFYELYKSSKYNIDMVDLTDIQSSLTFNKH